MSNEDAAPSENEALEQEEQRARARPFSYPRPERRAGVRAVRHISAEEADADMPPGIAGGYGTTGGGQPGGTGVGRPPGAPLEDAEYADTVGADPGEPPEREEEPPQGG